MAVELSGVVLQKDWSSIGKVFRQYWSSTEVVVEQHWNNVAVTGAVLEQ